MYIRIILLCFILAFTSSLKAQHWRLIKETKPFFAEYELDIVPDSLYELQSPDTFTSIAFKTFSDFKGMKLMMDGDTFEVKENDELYREDSLVISNLYIGYRPAKEVTFYSGHYNGKLRVFFHYAPKTNALPGNIRHKNMQPCNEPASVDQSFWRAGLPPPKAKPEATEVKHIIIHHSETANTDPDPLNTVRNIYLYHTQSNGWDDIGYNYLVAEDGTIFKGRDPQGVAPQDEIKGAHYCAKNSNTMGICVLGSFTAVAPSELAMQSLNDLCLYKCYFGQLDPSDAEKFPAGDPSSPLVYTVDGHRSGCATLCPGDMLYARLPWLRDTLSLQITGCEGLFANETTDEPAFSVYPNPSTGKVFFSNTGNESLVLLIYDMTGKALATINLPPNGQLSHTFQSAGLFAIKTTFPFHTGKSLVSIY